MTSLLPLSSMISTSRPRFSQKRLCFGMKKKAASPLDVRMACRHFSAARAVRSESIGAATIAAVPAANFRLVIISVSSTPPTQRTDERVDRPPQPRPRSAPTSVSTAAAVNGRPSAPR